MAVEVHAVKRTTFLGREVGVVLQNENGPCPLLAICNALVLRGTIQLNPDIPTVSTEDIIHLIGNCLLEQNSKPMSADMRANLLRTIDDVMGILPRMRFGLDVNVKFRSPVDFEFTPEMSVFDLVGMRLMHGWLVDPTDRKTSAAIGSDSYNKLVEKLISLLSPATVPATSPDSSTVRSPAQLVSPSAEAGSSAANPVDADAEMLSPNPADDVGSGSAGDGAGAGAGAGGGAGAGAGAGGAGVGASGTSGEFPASAGATDPFSRAPASPAQPPPTSEVATIKAFLDSSASQLTYYGLVRLHEEMKDREIGVFFRNNHFSTMFKMEKSLYLLVTDIGFRDQPSIVWERLDEIDGDTVYVNSMFRQPAASDVVSHVGSRAAPSLHDTPLVNPDFLLALNLQQQEQAAGGGAPAAVPAVPLESFVHGAATGAAPHPPPRDLAAEEQRQLEAALAASRVDAHTAPSAIPTAVRVLPPTATPSAAPPVAASRAAAPAASAPSGAASRPAPGRSVSGQPFHKSGNERYAAQAATLRDAHEAAKRQRQEMSDEELARRLHAEESAGGQVRGPQRAGGGGRATHGGGGGGDGDDKKKCVIM